MSKPVKSLLSSFKTSTDLVRVHDTYTHMSLPPSRHMRKSQVADYFANNKVSNVSGGRSTPAICLHRLPAAGVPTQIAELVKFDTYYLCEEGTASITIGAKKLTAEERKKADDDEHALTVHDYMPAMEILRAHGEFKFLVVPAYTVHAIMLQSGALMTVGHIAPKGEKDE
ncbi:hypothetical protein E8E11_002021 [Didymella keratinophila]|nr:hypothetical protein E8E11_002021 [Didymella keratinophila]